MKKISGFVLLAFMLMLMGCQSKNSQQQDESVVLHSYRLIDENRTDEAIVLLTDEINKLSKNTSEANNSAEMIELKITLASAYAKKAGLTVREMAKAIKQSQQIANINTMTTTSTSAEYAKNEKILHDFSELLLTYFKSFQIISVIPKIEPAKIVYLSQAVKIISSISDLSPADLIYSAVLKVVLVRTLLESNEIKQIIPVITKENNECVAKVGEFRDYLVRASKILISGLEDLTKALPDKKDEYMRSAHDIVEFSTHLSEINSAGLVINKLQPNALNQIHSLLGIGSQEINCDSVQNTSY